MLIKPNTKLYSKPPITVKWKIDTPCLGPALSYPADL